MVKIYSWNVNSLRNVEEKFLKFLDEYTPDIVFVQELRATQNQLSFFLQSVVGYKCVFSSAPKPGYAGTALYYKDTLNITNINTEIEGSILGMDGRFISFTLDNIFYAGFYIPNGTMSRERQQLKIKYLHEVTELALRKREEGMEVILVGDFNIAVDPRDLYAPNLNVNHSGFLPEDRQWAETLLNSGFCDAFRLFEAKGGFYTWWNLIDPTRQGNKGWRFDYFFISNGLKDICVNSKILREVFGSDHCPIVLELKGN